MVTMESSDVKTELETTIEGSRNDVNTSAKSSEGAPMEVYSSYIEPSSR